MKSLKKIVRLIPPGFRRRIMLQVMKLKGKKPDYEFHPTLDPTGAILERRELAPGCYALLANPAPVTNSGFIVGRNEVLVVDSHINGAMGLAIQAHVREVTDLPIRYLVNTSYHGDHWFGNYTFPAETRVLVHELTYQGTRFFEPERDLMLLMSPGDTYLDDVQPRRADDYFTNDLELDLGGIKVQVMHAGYGNTPGDTIVWVPEYEVMYTGNLVNGVGSLPPLRDGRPDAVVGTIEKLTRLAPKLIVPGHSVPHATEPLATMETLAEYHGYVIYLYEQTKRYVDRGKRHETTVESIRLPDPFRSANPQVMRTMETWHRFNVSQAYLVMTGQRIPRPFVDESNLHRST